MTCRCENGTFPCPSPTEKELCRKCRKSECDRHIVLPNREILKSADDWTALLSSLKKWQKSNNREDRYFDADHFPEKYPCLCFIEVRMDQQKKYVRDSGIGIGFHSDDDEYTETTVSKYTVNLKFLYADDVKALLEATL